jgi:hypothetical protein
MDVLSRVTDSIHDTGAYDSKVYRAVEFVDKHIVDNYEESFVYNLYDSTAAIDFMTSTMRTGGEFEFEGKTIYADDMVRDYFVRVVRLACELTSKQSDQSHVVGDISAIIKEPVMVSFMADVVITLVDANDQWVDGILNPEPGSEDNILNKFLAEIIEAYRDSITMLFVLDKFDNLVKNGRMSKVAALIAKTLIIKPLCVALDGEIAIKEKIRTSKGVYKRLVYKIEEYLPDTEGKELIIVHTKASEEVKFIVSLIEEKYKFKRIRVVENRGLNSFYALEKGLMVSFA